MRPRTLIDSNNRNPLELRQQDTYDRVRRTLDDALAELELEIELDEILDRPAAPLQ